MAACINHFLDHGSSAYTRHAFLLVQLLVDAASDNTTL
jgi:hypothetical protein